jgi:hypothetical protein
MHQHPAQAPRDPNNRTTSVQRSGVAGLQVILTGLVGARGVERVAELAGERR